MMKMKKIGSNRTVLEISVSDEYPFERILILFLGETPVAALVPDRGWLRTDRKYSKTITKHINSWIIFNSFPGFAVAKQIADPPAELGIVKTVPHEEIENLLGMAVDGLAARRYDRRW